MPLADGSVFLTSDVHWRPATGDAGSLGAFGDFLTELGALARARGAVELYVLGDLFDFWLERDGRGLDAYAPHVAALGAARDAGVRLTLLHGNRDFTYGAFLPERAGARIAGDRAVVQLGGRRALCEHGDLLCTRDWRYQLFRRVIRSRALRHASTLVPLERMTRVVASLRRASEAEIRRKPARALEVVDSAVERRLAEGFDVVVCGHVHRAARRRVGTGELVTLGAWDAGGGSYACWDGSELRLERYPG